MIDKVQAKQSLLALQAEYEERISKIDEHIRHPQDTDLAHDWDDQAVAVSQNDMRLNLLNEATENLGLVNHALAKIDSDEFGYCEECGEEIEEKRLASVPYAKMCMQHAH